MENKKYLKYINQKVNFTIDVYNEETDEYKTHNFIGKFIGLNNLYSRDDSDGVDYAVIMPDDDKGFDYDFFNEIDIKTIKLCKQEEIINFRISNEDKIKYQNLAKSKKIPLSRLIKNLLKEEIKNRTYGK